MLQLVRGGSGDSGLENLTLGLFFELLAQECKLMSRLVWYELYLIIGTTQLHYMRVMAIAADEEVIWSLE
jgi:hypothetical protein